MMDRKTGVFLEFSEDLSRDMGWPADCRETFASGSVPIAQASVMVRDMRFVWDYATMVEQSLTLGCSLLGSTAPGRDRGFWLFGVGSGTRLRDRISEYTKMWWSIPGRSFPASWRRGPFLELERGAFVGYVGMLQVPVEETRQVLERLRTHCGEAVIFSARAEVESEEELGAIRSASSGRGHHHAWGGVHWPALAAERCSRGDWLVRAGGSYDEREAFVDCFLPQPDGGRVLDWAADHSDAVTLVGLPD